MNILSERMSNLKPSVIREIFKHMADPEVISFAAGSPSSDAFPSEKIADITAEILRNESNVALQYSVSEGYPPLREWLKLRLTEKGIFTARKDAPDDVLITSGAQQAIEIITKLICNEGETVVCENPSFIGSLNSFRSYNANLVGVEMDDEGINLEKLESAFKSNPRTAFLYLIPNFQNPTGKTMSLKRRKDVLALCDKYKILIVEDDPYGELRFLGADIPSIKQLDVESDLGRVVYVGSFSKTLAPGLRVGFMCGVAPLLQKATVCIQASTVHTSILPQMVVHRFVTQNNFNQHIKKLQLLYKSKAKLMLDTLQFNMPLSIDFIEPEGGLFIWGTLPGSWDGLDAAMMMMFCRKALDNKVAIVPGNAFSPDERVPNLSFRLNFSYPSDDEIQKGVEILSKVAKTMFK
ncbi:MAG: PLP-dependent aminotransferase family protein [Oscillospiraceae bacterium]|nr:PLP-dependent aminotransferase family protein [Oscillospiraceae bacterium]